MNDVAVTGELAHLARHAVVKPHAKREQQVGFIHGVVGRDRAVHTEPAHRERVVGREPANPHQGRGDRDAGFLGKRPQFSRRAGGNDPATTVNHRPLAVVDPLGNLAGLRPADARVGIVSPQVHFFGVDRYAGGLLDIFRDVDPDRAGPAAGGEVKCFLDDPRDIRHVHHQVTVFDDGQGHAKHVGFLERALADHGARDLAADGDHRHGVQPGIGNAGHQVGGARTAGGNTDTGSARRAGVALGSEHLPLFMPRQDGTDLLRPRQGLVHFHAGTARVTEQQLDPFALETLDNQRRPLDGGGFGLAGGSSRGWGGSCWLAHGLVG